MCAKLLLRAARERIMSSDGLENRGGEEKKLRGAKMDCGRMSWRPMEEERCLHLLIHAGHTSVFPSPG